MAGDCHYLEGILEDGGSHILDAVNKRIVIEVRWEFQVICQKRLRSDHTQLLQCQWFAQASVWTCESRRINKTRHEV